MKTIAVLSSVVLIVGTVAVSCNPVPAAATVQLPIAYPYQLGPIGRYAFYDPNYPFKWTVDGGNEKESTPTPVGARQGGALLAGLLGYNLGLNYAAIRPMLQNGELTNQDLIAVALNLLRRPLLPLPIAQQ